MAGATGRVYEAGPVASRAGIGLRGPHVDALRATRPPVAFLEVHTENVFHAGGAFPRALDELAAIYPISLHGVGMSLGSSDGLDLRHVRRVGHAIRRFRPALVSEHVSWGRTAGEHFNDLLPLPFTEEAVEVLAANVSAVQDVLGRRLLMENVSQYLTYAHSALSEAEFLGALVDLSGCGLLLDVNNLYVNAVNAGIDPGAVVEYLDPASIHELHVAGHQRKDIDGATLLLDDHGSPVDDAVWSLYSSIIEAIGPRPTLVEWDTNLPALDRLLEEAALADRILVASHDTVAA